MVAEYTVPPLPGNKPGGTETVEKDVPTPESFMLYVQAVTQAVYNRLVEGGDRYGEEVLFALGETGAVVNCYQKSARALWSYRTGQIEKARDDTWLDLAGYAVLEIARKAWERGMDVTDIDGLFDRGKKRGTDHG